MAANTLFSGPYIYFSDNRDNTETPGVPLVGWQLSAFIAGTSTPVDLFHDSDLNTAWTQPIVGGANGISSDPVYCSPTPALKIVVLDADDVPLPGFPMDNFSPSQVAS
jgi:hypothetical protein